MLMVSLGKLGLPEIWDHCSLVEWDRRLMGWRERRVIGDRSQSLIGDWDRHLIGWRDRRLIRDRDQCVMRDRDRRLIGKQEQTKKKQRLNPQIIHSIETDVSWMSEWECPGTNNIILFLNHFRNKMIGVYLKNLSCKFFQKIGSWASYHEQSLRTLSKNRDN